MVRVRNADVSGPLKLPIQFIARLTGVTGDDIIPRDLWPYTPVPGVQPEAPAVQSAAIAV